MTTGITLLGLGPGDPDLLTLEAWKTIESAGEIYLRTDHHPVAERIPAGVKVISFDHLYEQADRFEDVYTEITRQILELGKRPEGVVYAVPGHPFVAEATCPEISRLAKEQGIPVRIVEGISFIEPVCSALGIDPFPRLVLADAIETGQRFFADFPPHYPALFTQIYSRQVAAELKSTLTAVYPDDHPVKLVHAAGTADMTVEELALFEIDRSPSIGITTALYVPPLSPENSFEGFVEIIARLRAPDGCPWDREQTHLSLRKHLLEETYEAIEAIEAGDGSKMAEELGDLLLQIVLHAQIGFEEGDFGMVDVIRGISEKIIRRHPHVFGEVNVSGVSDVLGNWEKLKAEERKENGESERSLLAGVPLALPSLTQAFELQDRAARVGFDWPSEDGVVDKIAEELGELDRAKTSAEFEDELGDVLFAVVNLARWHKVDAESALRGTNSKFRKRFGYIEASARERGLSVAELGFDELNRLWEEAKKI